MTYFLAALVIGAFLYYMKYMSSIDKFTITPSDFCILIENLPTHKFKLQKVADMLRDIFGESLSFELLQPYDVEYDTRTTKINIENLEH